MKKPKTGREGKKGFAELCSETNSHTRDSSVAGPKGLGESSVKSISDSLPAGNKVLLTTFTERVRELERQKRQYDIEGKYGAVARLKHKLEGLKEGYSLGEEAGIKKGKQDMIREIEGELERLPNSRDRHNEWRVAESVKMDIQSILQALKKREGIE